MHVLIAVVFGMLLTSISMIMTESYAEYSIPKDCKLNDRRPNLLDPHTFYWCLTDGPVLMKCVAGMYFNVTAGKCTEEYKEVSSEILTLSAEDTKEDTRCEQPKSTPHGIRCPAIDPLTHSIYYPDGSACECFYQCDNGVAKRRPCRKDLHFNRTTNRCDWPWEAGCVGPSGYGYAKDYENSYKIDINLLVNHV